MRNFAKVALSLSAALMVVGMMDTPEANARTQYQKQMGKIYPDLLKKHGTGKEGAKKFSCKVCHPGKTKKKRNDFGVALTKAMGKKNQKDEAKIKEAFEKVAKEKSGKDKAKTYGELIKDGKLPGSEKEAN
ncbi:MAG: hypothetical protein AB8G99_16605 [Planctomycetaceae bacterium]